MGFMAGGEGQAVGGAMDGEGDHHGGGDFAEPMAGGLVEMAGGTGGADMKQIFRNEREDRVTAAQGQEQAPPPERFKTLGQDAKNGDAKEGAGPEANEGAQPPVGLAEGGA